MSVCWEFGVPCYSYSYSCSCSVVGNRYWSKKQEYEEEKENGNVGSKEPGSDSLAVTSAMTLVDQDSLSSHFGT